MQQTAIVIRLGRKAQASRSRAASQPSLIQFILQGVHNNILSPCLLPPDSTNLEDANITFDHAWTTAQLELKEAAWWGKRHQKWPENGFASLKSGIFVLSVGRRPYHVSICAIARLPVKPNAKM